MTRTSQPVKPPPERAILVGVQIKGSRTDWNLDESMEELAQLARTAGAQIVGSLTQSLGRPTSMSYVGKGKLEELVAMKNELGCDLVLFDNSLSPNQQHNLEEALEVKVLDRAALILDIFARRAQTHEGRLQVELAQYEYLLSRLAGRWTHLERLGGGIGTRGPGETQLETDRRLIKNKIVRLKKEIEDVRQHRNLYRQRRTERGIPIVAIVGYTNAGKSALFNALSRSSVLVEDKLFATLDPTTRRITLPNGNAALISDTVGFIQKLPPMLVAAFRATLEELEEADILLHVVDIASPTAHQQFNTAEAFLKEIGLGDKPRLVVLNKIDLSGGQVNAEDKDIVRLYIERLGANITSAAVTSATKGWGLHRLLELIAEKLEKR